MTSKGPFQPKAFYDSVTWFSMNSPETRVFLICLLFWVSVYRASSLTILER